MQARNYLPSVIQPPASRGRHTEAQAGSSLHRLLSSKGTSGFQKKDPSFGLHAAWPSFGLKMMASQPTTMSEPIRLLLLGQTPGRGLFTPSDPASQAGATEMLRVLSCPPQTTPRGWTLLWGGSPPHYTPGWASGYNNYCTLWPECCFSLNFVCRNPNSPHDSIRRWGFEIRETPQGSRPSPREDTARSRQSAARKRTFSRT